MYQVIVAWLVVQQLNVIVLAFDHFPDRQLWMFPFHTLLFTLQLVMVDPCFVTSDD
jgi:hypothetical protein